MQHCRNIVAPPVPAACVVAEPVRSEESGRANKQRHTKKQQRRRRQELKLCYEAEKTEVHACAEAIVEHSEHRHQAKVAGGVSDIMSRSNLSHLAPKDHAIGSGQSGFGMTVWQSKVHRGAKQRWADYESDDGVK